METRGILKRILTGNVSAREARQQLTGSIYDLDLLTQLEYESYFNIARKIEQSGYESLIDYELYLCILLCCKATHEARYRYILENLELTYLELEQMMTLYDSLRT